jgi:hypothetical protein
LDVLVSEAPPRAKGSVRGVEYREVSELVIELVEEGGGEVSAEFAVEETVFGGGEPIRVNDAGGKAALGGMVCIHLLGGKVALSPDVGTIRSP